MAARAGLLVHLQDPGLFHRKRTLLAPPAAACRGRRCLALLRAPAIGSAAGRGRPPPPLEVHVLDPQAGRWAERVRGAFGPELDALCRLVPTDADAHQWGARDPARRAALRNAGYDAVFVGLGDEPHAFVQAAALREVFPEAVPVVVR